MYSTTNCISIHETVLYWSYNLQFWEYVVRFVNSEKKTSIKATVTKPAQPFKTKPTNKIEVSCFGSTGEWLAKPGIRLIKQTHLFVVSLMYNDVSTTTISSCWPFHQSNPAVDMIDIVTLRSGIATFASVLTLTTCYVLINHTTVDKWWWNFVTDLLKMDFQ